MALPDLVDSGPVGDKGNWPVPTRARCFWGRLRGCLSRGHDHSGVSIMRAPPWPSTAAISSFSPSDRWRPEEILWPTSTPQRAGTPSHPATSKRCAAGLPSSVTRPAAFQSSGAMLPTGWDATMTSRGQNRAASSALRMYRSRPTPQPPAAGIPAKVSPWEVITPYVHASQFVVPTRRMGPCWPEGAGSKLSGSRYQIQPGRGITPEAVRARPNSSRLRSCP